MTVSPMRVSPPVDIVRKVKAAKRRVDTPARKAKQGQFSNQFAPTIRDRIFKSSIRNPKSESVRFSQALPITLEGIEVTDNARRAETNAAAGSLRSSSATMNHPIKAVGVATV